MLWHPKKSYKSNWQPFPSYHSSLSSGLKIEISKIFTMANNVSNFPELHFSSDFYFTVCLHFRDGNRRPRHLSGAPRN